MLSQWLRHGYARACFYTGLNRPGVKFCPHCGLAGALEAAEDTSPMDVIVASRTYRVLDRIAIGSISSIYRCRFNDGSREVEGVCKVAGMRDRTG